MWFVEDKGEILDKDLRLALILQKVGGVKYAFCLCHCVLSVGFRVSGDNCRTLEDLLLVFKRISWEK
jgi:hypothetical protein